MDIFKNRNFVRLFFAALASQMGTTVGNMAFAFFFAGPIQQPAFIYDLGGADVFSSDHICISDRGSRRGPV